MKQTSSKEVRSQGWKGLKKWDYLEVNFTLSIFAGYGEKQSSENSYLTPMASIAIEKRNQKDVCHRLEYCQ